MYSVVYSTFISCFLFYRPISLKELRKNAYEVVFVDTKLLRELINGDTKKIIIRSG